ncbi:MAG: hypothetical protein KAQ89_07090 [Planctomycetes bacterium]|nr:hypothetical protein [Planctomycetota bacterium]
MKKFLNILIALVVYGVSCFVFSGATATIWWRIENGPVAPEMFGWYGAFLMVGWLCSLLSIGGLIVVGVYGCLNKGTSKIVAGTSAITGLSSGLIFAVITRFCDIDNFFSILFIPLIIVVLNLAICHWMYSGQKNKAQNPTLQSVNFYCIV